MFFLIIYASYMAFDIYYCCNFIFSCDSHQVLFATGREMTVAPETWLLQSNGEEARRIQIPLDLGWNFSIHRSQVKDFL